MRKVGVLFLSVFFLVAALFVVSAETGFDEGVKAAVDRAANGGNVSASVEAFVSEFVKKRGIQPESIRNIKPVDFNALPKEVNIENIGDTNLAIYEIGYDSAENPGSQEKVFVVSYSLDEIKAQGDLIVAHSQRNFLNFGSSQAMSSSGFLDTATGVETSEGKGYVMARKGSITGLSTNLEVIQGNLNGKIEIILLKNGKPISFGNTVDASEIGIKKDYDVQSKEIVSFEPGDVISAYASSQGSVAWRDAIVLVEITTVN